MPGPKRKSRRGPRNPVVPMLWPDVPAPVREERGSRWMGLLRAVTLGIVGGRRQHAGSQKCRPITSQDQMNPSIEAG